MLQKSVENFAENDVKFKELVKDIVREELKSYKEHNDKQIQIIFEKLQLYREDLRITYKLIQEIIELFGLHKKNSELRFEKQIDILDNIFEKQIDIFDNIFESLENLQMDYKEYKKDISELFKEQMTIFDSIFESNDAEEQSSKEAKPKTKAEIWEEQKARHLNKAEKNKVEILDTKGSSDGK